jgi:flavin reductase (DIM6/NTAB) family NADH-FMN oxidoreductase RutF
MPQQRLIQHQIFTIIYHLINKNMPTAISKNEIDPLDLRRAFGRFGTGVTVITTRAADGTPVGVTANSFNTVSLDPPIVLWSLAGTSPSLGVFRSTGHFAVNVLTLDQIELSRRFSRSAVDKFAGVAFTDGLQGAPILAGCAASIECTVVNEHVVGDHVLFLGQVKRYAHENAAPLLFFNGKYIQGVELDGSSSAHGSTPHTPALIARAA